MLSLSNKGLDRLIGKISVERLHQREILAQRDRNLRIAQRCKKLNEHAGKIARPTVPVKGCSQRASPRFPFYALVFSCNGMSSIIQSAGYPLVADSTLDLPAFSIKLAATTAAPVRQRRVITYSFAQ